ncbi:MAG: hypothetical protein QOF85_938 [Solirubrobacterales bacterium]|jgi:hypothetical protein|nr:hypothetical protein [Solirubrobacterales bacterium]
MSGERPEPGARDIAERIEASYPGSELDLARLLEKRRGNWGRVIRPFKDFANWAVRHYAVSGSVVAVLAGGFYTLAYSTFYGNLDISPEQAGLTTSEILTHSVLGGLTLVALLAITFAAIFISLIGIQSTEDLGPGTWTDFGSNMFISAAALSVMGVAFFLAGAPLALWLFLTVVAVLVALPVSLTFRYGGPLPKPANFEFAWEAYVAFLVAGAIPFGLAGAAVGTFIEAEKLGTTASSGGAVRNPTIAGIPFLGVQAQPAFVDWANEAEAKRVPRCLLYLGSADGQLALYDAKDGTTIEAPSHDAIVQLRGNRSSCEAPVNLSVPSVHRVGSTSFRCGPGNWESDPQPRFEYDWTVEGETIVGGRSKTSVLDARGLTGPLVVHCNVTASTPLGEDTALSGGVIVGARSG